MEGFDETVNQHRASQHSGDGDLVEYLGLRAELQERWCEYEELGRTRPTPCCCHVWTLKGCLWSSGGTTSSLASQGRASSCSTGA